MIKAEAFGCHARWVYGKYQCTYGLHPHQLMWLGLGFTTLFLIIIGCIHLIVKERRRK